MLKSDNHIYGRANRQAQYCGVKLKNSFPCVEESGFPPWPPVCSAWAGKPVHVPDGVFLHEAYGHAKQGGRADGFCYLPMPGDPASVARRDGPERSMRVLWKMPVPRPVHARTGRGRCSTAEAPCAHGEFLPATVPRTDNTCYIGLTSEASLSYAEFS